MADKPSVACAVLHTDRSGNPVPCPGYPDPPDNPCYVHGMGSPHDAHDRTDGQGRCPGYGEPDDGAKEPARSQTIAEQVHDLEYVIQRVREAVGTDMVLVSCEEHDAALSRMRALHQPCAREDEGDADYCSHCSDIGDSWMQYPCPTIRALDGEAN